MDQWSAVVEKFSVILFIQHGSKLTGLRDDLCNYVFFVLHVSG